MGVDFSHAVIHQMRQHHQNEHQAEKQEFEGRVHYFGMDARELSLSDQSVAAVVDKGLLDSVLSAYDRVHMWAKLQPDKRLPHQAAHDSLQAGHQVLDEISRVLKPGGVYVAVSYEDPALRLPILRGHVLCYQHPALRVAMEGEEEQERHMRGAGLEAAGSVRSDVRSLEAAGSVRSDRFTRVEHRAFDQDHNFHLYTCTRP